MADRHSREQRSYNMSRIKNANTKPEIALRKLLFARGFRYRINVKKLPGKPDIVLKKYNVAIFINGCFWHGHQNCKFFIMPKTRQEFWVKKINRNKERDSENIQNLKEIGWKIIVVWECELKKDKLENTLKKVIKKIKTSY